MHPEYELKIGFETFTSKNSEVPSLEIRRKMGLPIDSLEVTLVSRKSYSFKKDDDIAVKLGYDSKVVPVFSGLVDEFEIGISKVRLYGAGKSVKLLNMKINRVYQNQTAGDIVRSLSQDAGLKVKDCDDGIKFPYYVIDERYNAYEHLLKIADRCDFDVYITEEGELVFKRYAGKKKHTLEYGKDVIKAEFLNSPKLYQGTAVYGESPSSSKGANTYHWLTKKEVKGSAGSGVLLAIHDVAIKTQDDAGKVSQAVQSRLEYTSSLMVDTVGDPEIRLGDAIVLKGFISNSMKGEYEINGLEHCLSKASGFTSRIFCRRKR